MKRSRRSRTALFVAAVASALALSTTPIATAAEAPEPASDEFYVVAGNGAVWAPSGLEHWEPAPAPRPKRGEVTPMLLDPVDSYQCNVRNNSSHMITSYSAARGGGYGGGTIRLFCGTHNASTNTGSGFKHIRERHQGEWQTKKDSWGLGGTWDDFMDWATASALAAPSEATDQGNGKSCFTAPIQLRRSDGTVAATFYPRVIISRNNTLVITSIPGGGC